MHNALPEGLFLEKMNDWAPRDVLAHLIGWNRYTIEGCQQISKGETPFYLIDPGDDFSKVNAVLVQRYDSRDERQLLDELKASAEELKQFLLSLGSVEREAGYGVSYADHGVGYEGAVTIRNTVDMLIYDYVEHREQIEEWVKSHESA